jgi:hypothetical protein
MSNGPCELWRRLDGDRQKDIVSAYTEAHSHQGLDREEVERIADILRYRPNMVRRARGEQLGRLLRKSIALGSDVTALNMMVHFHIADRADLLGRVYDALGAEHEGAILDQSVMDAKLDEESAFERSVELARSDPSRQVALCLEVMRLACSRAWHPTISRIVEALRDRGLSIDVPTAPESVTMPLRSVGRPPSVPPPRGPLPERPAEAVAEPQTSAEPELERPQFSTLDKVLIRTVISSLNDVHGAFDVDEIDDLVQETLELNDSRAQSYFHRGFLDSLTEKPCQPMGPGENAQRRAWYLVGFCQGLMRRKGAREAVSFMVHLEPGDSRVLLDSPVDAGVLMMPVLIRPLLDSGSFDIAGRWIQTYVRHCPKETIPRVVDWAKMALLDSDPSLVERILDHCRSRIVESPGYDEPLLAPEFERLDRRLAIALRLQGKMTQAEAIVDDLLSRDTDEITRSKLLGDKLLLRMGMRSLENLRIVKEETRDALSIALEGVAPMIESAVSGAEPSPVADLAAGIRTLLDSALPDIDIRQGVECLHRAIRGLEVWNRKFWTERGVLPRARFYLSVLELRLLDQAVAVPATTRLIGLVESGIDEPIDLVVDAINHAVVQDIADADRLAREALRRWPQAVLTRLDLMNLVKRSRPFLEQLVDALEKNENLLTVEERWRSWSSVLRGTLRAGERDVETAGRALDELESLAELHGCTSEFARLLQQRDNWDPAWSANDAEMARFKVLSATGNLDTARAVLVNIAHRAITAKDYDAGDLVDMLRTLGAEPQALAELDRRLEAAFPPEDDGEGEVLDEGAPVSVLFVGGNESQAAYRPGLLESIGRDCPGCEIRFEFSGWSSNWGRELERYRTVLEDVDIVVIMRFVRTQLGRHLRKAAGIAGIPWVACTGHGKDSIERTIRRAINVARQHRRSAEGQGGVR